MGFGVKLNTLAVALPILLLGIGVDDAFVLIAAYRDVSVRRGCFLDPPLCSQHRMNHEPRTTSSEP
jgi:hypothetical protein